MGLKIPEAYFYETYGIPKPEEGGVIVNKKEAEPAKPEDDPEDIDPEEKPDPEEEENSKSPQQKVDEKKERTFKNWLRDFFVHAPEEGALGW